MAASSVSQRQPGILRRAEHIWSFTMLATFARILAILQARPSHAQFVSASTQNMTTVQSPLNTNINITYTRTNSLCKTAFSEQDQYSGWVSIAGEYPTNTFFWFVEGRQPTSLLSVYLNGGPGASSMFGMFAEVGPCEVIEKGIDQLDTQVREWGWDRASNMLFIDQPNQVGFSYDELRNGTLALQNNTISVPPISPKNATLAGLYLNGTFATQLGNHTSNTTALAAMAAYHAVQGFLAQFPQYSPTNSSMGVNLFAESYGGHYGPAFARQWQKQNDLRLNSTTVRSTTVDIHLESLGLINGCVDDLIGAPYYASMLVNNSYGLDIVQPLQASLINASFYSSGGCGDMIRACRAAVNLTDRYNSGNNSTVNNACSDAMSQCNEQVIAPYLDSGRSFYDIAYSSPQSFPSSLYVGYLNSQPVQNKLGASLNYTDSSNLVYTMFQKTGDFERGDPVGDMAELLQSGVRIGMMYGDRDFGCNWLAGEAVSLAVAEAAGDQYASRFPSAGYAPIIVNSSYIGGVVRQFGNLSFSRIYQAGHFVPAYQPETAFQVFARIILGTDIGTGKSVDLNTFNTSGPANATSSLPLPKNPKATCYLRHLSGSCLDEQINSYIAGQGVVINDVWYPASSDWPGAAISASPATATSTDEPGSPTATTTSGSTHSLTGVYTATATPGAAEALPRPPPIQSVAAVSLTTWLFFCIGVFI